MDEHGLRGGFGGISPRVSLDGFHGYVARKQEMWNAGRAWRRQMGEGAFSGRRCLVILHLFPML